MFKQLRRKEKLMREDDSAEILKRGVYGTLASIGVNGYPYSIPLNYAYENGVLYFHSAPEGNKVNNINFNNKVSFSVVDYVKVLPEKFDTEYDSVVIYGKAYQLTDEKEKHHALMLLIKKYSGNYMKEGTEYVLRAANSASVFKIDIEFLTGKRGR